MEDPSLQAQRLAHREIALSGSSEPTPIVSVNAEDEPRMASGLAEFDRVAGGGLVPGSVLLLGGDPGIGKSTLVLQVLHRLAELGRKVLYVTGEESVRQVKLRADRLKALHENLLVASITDLEKIQKVARELKPAVLAVDSIQTVFAPDLSSAPGSVSQVRECAGRLTGLAKRRSLTVLLVGHVTKDGTLAGPRVLEHMVDTVIAFEGERGVPFRVLRATKNRFGSTNEVGVFEMQGAGLMEVNDPSRLFLAERPKDEPGSVVTVTVEGTRPLLVEVQALVSPAAYGTARRTTIGVDPNRVALLAAVLEKKAGLDLVGCDIFVNVAGGVKLSEPAADLGLAIALASSFVDKPVPAETLVFGELGLAGEVRSVGQPDLRLTEAHKMGFLRALTPDMKLGDFKVPKELKLTRVKSLSQAIEELF